MFAGGKPIIDGTLIKETIPEVIILQQLVGASIGCNYVPRGLYNSSLMLDDWYRVSCTEEERNIYFSISALNIYMKLSPMLNGIMSGLDLLLSVCSNTGFASHAEGRKERK